MSTHDPIEKFRPDYFLVLVKRPQGWRPKNTFEVPNYQFQHVISRSVVASYSEAHDDLVRCNRISLQNDLDTWAVIEEASRKDI
jgi:hypothetical protein